MHEEKWGTECFQEKNHNILKQYISDVTAYLSKV